MNYIKPKILAILSSCEEVLLAGSNEMIGGEDLDFLETEISG
jgi:hypothetical protein